MSSRATSPRPRRCHLCEAACGLDIEFDGDRPVGARGRRTAVLSAGYVCAKGSALLDIDADPDRLRRPLVRRDGELVEVSWEEAFAEAAARLRPVIEEHGRHTVAVYSGNPGGSTELFFKAALIHALSTPHIYSAASVDASSKAFASGLLFGVPWSTAVPDLDNTDHLLIVGANPVDSNGSLLTAPNMAARLRAIRASGGKVVVLDPRRTRTAEQADEHHFIRPGTDALALFAMVHTLFEEGLVDLRHLDGRVEGVAELGALASPFTPEAVADRCGIPAPTLRRLARDLAAAPSAAVYGRVGTSTQAFGMLASFLIDALNVLTGNLDRRGGAMFPLPAQGSPTTHGKPGPGRGMRWGRWQSRVRGLKEFAGELPVAALAEEIDTPGDDRVRAAIFIAGNPVLSTPNGGRLDAALPMLDCQISIDIYLNETSRHAHVVFPSPRLLTRGHAQGFATWNACQNFYDYSPPLLAREPGELGDGEILMRLTAIVEGRDPNAEDVDDRMAAFVAQRAAAAAQQFGITADDVLASLDAGEPAEQLVELNIRSGPYGDRFGQWPEGLTFRQLREAPDGVDLGPLQPRVDEILRTASGKIELAPEPVAIDSTRLAAALAEPVPGLLLFGRRDRRSMNSWLHNVGRLTTESDRCTVQLHPLDAAEAGVVSGQAVVVTSRVGSVTAPVEVTDAVMPGSVCVPHGFGHGKAADSLRVAALTPGASANDLTDDGVVEPWSSVAVFSGVPVQVAPAT